MTTKNTFDNLKNDIFNMWSSCKLDEEPEKLHYTTKMAMTIISNKERYKAVEASVGVPWYLIGCIHYMEASFNFKSALHNGDEIIGTGEYTYHVPKGRGPFNTWEEAAIDSFVYENLNNIKNWTIEYCLWAAEAYNGFGYRKYNVNTPYVWAFTNHSSEKGVFVRDHIFDINAPHDRPGVAAILKYLEINGYIEYKRLWPVSDVKDPAESIKEIKQDESAVIIPFPKKDNFLMLFIKFIKSLFKK